MRSIVFDPLSGRLRAGWRLLLFTGLFLPITIGAMTGTRAILGRLKAGSNLQFTILAVTATLSVFIARRYLDKKSFLSLGLRFDRRAFLDVVSGVINSAVLMAGVFLLMLSLNLIEFNGFTWWHDPSAAAASGIRSTAAFAVAAVFFKLTMVAWNEELIFRGYIFQNLVDGTNVMWATVIASVIFGASHAFNPGATVLSTVLIAGITTQLIYAYLKTQQLWLPMGLHLGWNFFQASVFGFAASGQSSPGLISQTPVGPEWLSGGRFGAEGSVLIVPFTLLSFVAINWWAKRIHPAGLTAPTDAEHLASDGQLQAAT